MLVQYNNVPNDVLDRLRAIVARYNTQVVLAPYPAMPHPVALTAWTCLGAFDEFDERRIIRFIGAYRGIDHHPVGGEG